MKRIHVALLATAAVVLLTTAGHSQRRQTVVAESPPAGKDQGETRILKVLAEAPRVHGSSSNVPDIDGRMLRLLTEAAGAKRVVEIGTSNGISGLWFLLALRKTGGKLITYDIDPAAVAAARKNFNAAGVGELATIVEGNAHETIARLRGPIDVVFIDADKSGYLDYFQKLLPSVRPGGLILAHNTTPTMADPAFIKAITGSPNLETLFYTRGAGMSVTLKKRD
jgi:caffeoyl-CoA O-methyltransferase